MYSVLHLIATQPQMLLEHAEAYADLVQSEIGCASAIWKRRLLLAACGLALLAVGLGLAGVALLLWAVTPAAQVHAAWLLLAVPLLPIATAIGCLLAARASSDGGSFSQLLLQLKADLRLLREASAA